jgi:hypothetical protein
MRLSLRLIALVLAGGALLAAARSQPALTEGLGRALGLTGSEEEQETQRRAEMARRNLILIRRHAAKEKVVKAVLEGRMSLLQAARLFQDLDENPADCRNDYRSFFPGRSDGEKLCRQVLEWTQSQMVDAPPSQAAAVLERLQAELQENMDRNGGLVVLPG